MRRREEQRGFALLLSLALLMLAAVLLLSLSRRSAALAAEALQARDDLQRKWAAQSLRDALLPYADELLNEAAERRREPVAVLRGRIVLGEVEVDYALADEQAKANLNALYARVEAEQVERAVRSLLSGDVGAANVQLRPDPRAPEPQRSSFEDEAGQAPREGEEPSPQQPSPQLPEAEARAFATWAQVFENVTPFELYAPKERGLGVVEHLTLWGDGRINLERASREAIEVAAAGLLRPGQAGELMELRNAPGSGGEGGAWGALGLATDSQGEGEQGSNNTRQRQLRRLLRRGSDCYSIAMSIAGPTRIDDELWVMQTIPRREGENGEPASGAENQGQPPAETAQRPEAARVRDDSRGGEGEPEAVRVYRLRW